MSHSASIWGIWHPQIGLVNTFQPTRNAAIAEFCRMMDADSYDEAVDEAKSGRVWFSAPSLTARQRRAWRRFRDNGYMAVHVEAVVRDFRATARLAAEREAQAQEDMT